MKLMVPVFGMFVASGLCCCCGGGSDDWQQQIEEMEKGADAGSSEATTTTTEAPTDDAASGSASSGGGAATLSGTTEGTCGSFQSDGVKVADGLHVLACVVSGDSESFTMQGSGSPKDLCTSYKGWATGAGWTVTTEADLMGTQSVLFSKGGKRLTMSCTDMTGQTTVSLVISPG